MRAVSLQTTGIETLGSTYARSFLIACPLILQPPNDSAGHSMLAKRDCFTRMFSCVRNCTLILMAIQYECQRTVWHCTNLRFKFLIQRSLIAQRHDNPLQLDSSRRCWHCSHVLLGWSRLMFGYTLPKPFASCTVTVYSLHFERKHHSATAIGMTTAPCPSRGPGLAEFGLGLWLRQTDATDRRMTEDHLRGDTRCSLDLIHCMLGNGCIYIYPTRQRWSLTSRFTNTMFHPVKHRIC